MGRGSSGLDATHRVMTCYSRGLDTREHDRLTCIFCRRTAHLMDVKRKILTYRSAAEMVADAIGQRGGKS